MLASALFPWGALVGTLWLGVVILFWAVCRAAAIADREDLAAAAAADPEVEPPMPMAAAVVAAAAIWLESDDGVLFAGTDASTLRPLAMTRSAQQSLLLGAAGRAVATGNSVEVRDDSNGEPGLVIATPVRCAGQVAGALAFGLEGAGPRVSFAQRRALNALADAASALPTIAEAVAPARVS